MAKGLADKIRGYYQRTPLGLLVMIAWVVSCRNWGVALVSIGSFLLGVSDGLMVCSNLLAGAEERAKEFRDKLTIENKNLRSIVSKLAAIAGSQDAKQ